MTDNQHKTKKNLIKWINDISDEKTINMLNSLRLSLDLESGEQKLSREEKKQIKKGFNDYRNGRYVSSNEFWKKLNNAS